MPATMPASACSVYTPARFRQDVLQWYDKYARTLPWRAATGQRPDPYHVWLSEVMLQQTTVQAVIPYFGKFVDKWPTVHDLAAAPDEAVMQAWAGLGYYARARNLLKCARVISENHAGHFPDQEDGLRGLPGIGDYTAAAIAAIAFDRVATVIDGNVDRVVSRHFAIEEPLPGSKPVIREKAQLLFTPDSGEPSRPGDFAQAMMDLGATICTPRTPKCALCPVMESCAARRAGIAGDLPRRAEKKPQPRRAGYVYWITNPQGEVLLQKRPEKGLLGGMTGLPTSDWVDWPGTSRKWPTISHISAIKASDHDSMKKGAKIRHTFTHFSLELQGIHLAVPASFAAPDGHFWAFSGQVLDKGLPTVFRKFARLAISRKTAIEDD